jgi:hypothetical protein
MSLSIIINKIMNLGGGADVKCFEEDMKNM